MKFQHQIVVFIIICSVLILISCGRGVLGSKATTDRSVSFYSGVSVRVFDYTEKASMNPSKNSFHNVTNAGDFRPIVFSKLQPDSIRMCIRKTMLLRDNMFLTDCQCEDGVSARVLNGFCQVRKT